MSTQLNPSNTLNPEDQVSFPSCQSLCALSRIITETSEHGPHNVTERGKQEAPCLHLPQALSCA